jgi:glycosyltransferase involved in cell wall biosynthesis
MKILVLWSHNSGYLHECLDSLSQVADVTGVFFLPSDDSPFDRDMFQTASYSTFWLNPTSETSVNNVFNSIRKLSPDLCLVSGWHHNFYIQYLTDHLKNSCVNVLCFDWQWQPTLRNYVKAAYGLLFRSRLFQAAFICGERQYQFARRIGFQASQIYHGLYAANPLTFTPVEWAKRSDSVAFVGRLVDSKGCEDLVQAWRSLYDSDLISSRWHLDIYGTGPFSEALSSLPNTCMHGFTQPKDLSKQISRSKILCAPSREEPWGLQIHEASSAGLAIIATHACGSAVHLVRSRFNGELIPASQPSSLASAMLRLIMMDDGDKSGLETYSKNSRSMSFQYTPQIWSDTVLKMFSDSVFTF